MSARIALALILPVLVSCSRELICVEARFCDGNRVMQRAADCSTSLYETCAATIRVCSEGLCLHTEGERCEESRQCESGNCTGEGTDRICGPMLQCQDDADCSGGSPYCVRGSCESGAPGAPCIQNDDCSAQAPYCAEQRCSEGQAGDPCDDSADCSMEAPICGGHRCSDGGEGSRCDDATECSEPARFCVDYWSWEAPQCQSGQEGAPCAEDMDCLESAPHCVNEHERFLERYEVYACRVGRAGDPCADAGDCEGSLLCTAIHPDMLRCGRGEQGEGCLPDLDPPCASSAPFCVNIDIDFQTRHECQTGEVGSPCRTHDECVGALRCSGFGGLGECES